MVTAGVYMIGRNAVLFGHAPHTLDVVAVIGCVTALMAGTIGLVQNDIKRVLAYSTVSQLAYMLGALACGSRDAAIFHLLVHAAFKALGFLAAGAVIHAVGSNLMSRMGGLAGPMRVTTTTMAVAMASGAGVVPLAGFFSKESVLSAADRAASGDVAGVSTWVGWLVLVTAVLTVAVTAAYSTRLLLMTFAGRYRGDAAALHDPPPLMRWPLVVLAVPAAALGVLGLGSGWLPTWLGLGPAQALTPGAVTTVLSLLLVVAGAGALWSSWRRAPDLDPVRPLLGPAWDWCAAGFGVDTVYERLVIRPVRALAGRVVAADDELGAGVQGTVTATLRASLGLRRWQAGNPQTYLTSALTGVTVLLVVAVVAVWS
jgi:NADH-quinone oxidoreductase subunit L